MNGTVKKLLIEKGFGFILGTDNKEYFFHSTAVTENGWSDLTEGQAVTFKPVEGQKGPRAEQVVPQ